MHKVWSNPFSWLMVLGLVSFFPFLGSTHLFDWDEINFAESAREMIVTGDFLRVRINYEPFWEKPPFFFWLQVLSMKLLGINEWGARFPNAIFGLITLVTLYLIGRKEKNVSFGMIWSLLYAGSLLPHLYFRSGIIDPVFNYFIFLGIYFLYRTTQAESKRLDLAAYAGIATGVSVLTKGPVGFLLVLLTFLVIWVSRKLSRRIAHYQEVLVFALAVFLVSCFWFGWETVQNGPWYLVEFIQYQISLFSEPVAGHAQPWYYHIVVVFLGCFPISIFGLKKLFKSSGDYPMDGWMRGIFWVVLILFSYVTTKIVHYSSMTYLPLSYLAAREVFQWVQGKSTPGWMLWLYGFFGGIWSLLIGFIGWLLIHQQNLKTWVKGKFANASLEVPLTADSWIWMIGLILLIAVIFATLNYKHKNIMRALWVHSVGLSVTLTMVAGFVLPHIEKLSQGPAIEFFEAHADEEVYLMTEGHKSYAPYFYGKVMPYPKVQATDKRWLLTGSIDRPVYIAVKVNKIGRMEQYEDIERLYQKGGFVFFIRRP